MCGRFLWGLDVGTKRYMTTATTRARLIQAAVLAAIVCVAVALVVWGDQRLVQQRRRSVAVEAFDDGDGGATISPDEPAPRHHDRVIVREVFEHVLHRLPESQEEASYGRLVALGRLTRESLTALLRTTHEYAGTDGLGVDLDEIPAEARQAWRDANGGEEPRRDVDQRHCMTTWKDTGFDADATYRQLKEERRASHAEADRFLRGAPAYGFQDSMVSMDSATSTTSMHKGPEWRDDHEVRRALSRSRHCRPRQAPPLPPPSPADEILLAVKMSDRDRDLQRIQCVRACDGNRLSASIQDRIDRQGGQGGQGGQDCRDVPETKGRRELHHERHEREEDDDDGIREARRLPRSERGEPDPRLDQSALIGTVLTEAKDTGIGSIVPPYIYAGWGKSFNEG